MIRYMSASDTEGNFGQSLRRSPRTEGADPETVHRYTVKRYESEKLEAGDAWRHQRIVLRPINPGHAPIVLDEKSEGTVDVIAEVIEVLGTLAPS
jgi:hypothetical protein